MNGDEQPARPSSPRKAKGVVLFVLIAAALYIGVHGAIRGWELQRRLVCAGHLKDLGTLGTPRWPTDVPILQWLAEHKCPNAPNPNYVIVAAALERIGAVSDPRTVVAYEPRSNHGGEGGNILFADGHVSFVRAAAYDELIATIPRTGSLSGVND